MKESDILLAASQMIRLHGIGASEAAAGRARSMLGQGDVEGFHTWKRIADAIHDLARQKPGPGETES